MQLASKEANLVTIHALENDSKLSIRAAARIYKVSEATLQRRHTSKSSQYNILAKLRKLTDSEEGILLEHILDLDSQGFQPRLYDIQAMANRLLALCNMSGIGPR